MRREYCSKGAEESKGEESESKKLYVRAYDEFLNGRPEEASALLDQIAKEDEHYTLVLALRGRIAMLQERLEEAMEYFEESLELNDANPVAYYYKASLHEMLGETAEAIQSLADCIDVDPDFAVARTELASHLISTGAFQEAIKHCDYCLQSHPSMEQALYWKAYALYHMQRYQEALKILELYDDYADTYAVRLAALAGETELALGNITKAKSYFVKAYKENRYVFPDRSLCKLAVLTSEAGNTAEALRMMQDRLMEEAALQHHLKEETAASLKLNHKEQPPKIDLSASVTMRHKNKRDTESYALILCVYAGLQWSSGDSDGAIHTLEDSFQTEPKNSLIAYRYISYLFRLRLFDKMLDALSPGGVTGPELFPNDSNLLLWRLSILLRLNNPKEVLEIVEKEALNSEPISSSSSASVGTKSSQKSSTSSLDTKVNQLEETSGIPRPNLEIWKMSALSLLGGPSELEEASRIYQQIQHEAMSGNLTKDPREIVCIASAAVKMKKEEEATSLIKKQIVTLSNSGPDALALGYDFVEHNLAEKDGEGKLRNWVLVQIAARFPNDYYFLNDLANLRVMLGDFDFAITVWKHIAKLYPSNASAWNSIGNCYAAQFKHLEALAQFKRAQQCDFPDHIIYESSVKEAVTLLFLQRFEQALDKFENVISASSSSPFVPSDIGYRAYGAVLSGQFEQVFGSPVPEKYFDLEAAVPLLKAAASNRCARFSDLPDTLEMLVTTLTKLGQHDEAKRYQQQLDQYLPSE